MRPPLSTLTSRLVVLTVLSTLLVAIAIGAATTLAMRANLTNALDTEVSALAGRADKHSPGSTPPNGGSSGGSSGGGCESRWFGGNQGPGTLFAEIDPTASTASNDEGLVVTEEFCGQEDLSEADLETLRKVPADGRVHHVDLEGVGSYRVVVSETESGSQLVAGLPTSSVDKAVSSLLLYELLIGLAAVVVAGGSAAIVVRRQLRPLREVATTAHEVAELPLADTEVELSDRVPAHLRNERNEVGQVGDALAILLEHVESAIDARHRSEQQVRQFVADASHELRTPIATIAGYAELARRRPDDAEAARTALSKVEAESDRMRRLVEDLLMLARLDAGRPLASEPVDLTMLALEATEDARVLAPEHHWRLDLSDEAVEVVGDAHGLHQVITNLLTNARRYTPAGTTVTVSVRPLETCARIAVHDDGPGFAPEILSSAFDRFVRGDVARTRLDSGGGAGGTTGAGGSGLGLALVRAIVEAHGGTVELASTPGDTTVAVRLPLRGSESDSATP